MHLAGTIFAVVMFVWFTGGIIWSINHRLHSTTPGAPRSGDEEEE